MNAVYTYQTGQPLPAANETTKGISIHRHEFKLKNGRLFRLNVWDFGGQEILHSTHQFFLTERSLYILVLEPRTGFAQRDAEYVRAYSLWRDAALLLATIPAALRGRGAF